MKSVGIHMSHGKDRGGRANESKRRESLLIHSVNKYLMSVYYTASTILGGMVGMETGKILLSVLCNPLPRELRQVSK